MNYKLRKNGFSLTEVLLAVGALAIGMLFIAGAFPVGIHLTTIATERTIAAVVADEAFAKIRLYGIDPNNNELDKDGKDFTLFTDRILPDIHDYVSDETIEEESTYPSTDTDISQKQYCWSALCRLTEKYDAQKNPNPPVQVTVFVCRRTSPNLEYYGEDGKWPVPVKVDVSGGYNELEIESGKESFINDGYTIVDDRTGRLYRVLERYKGDYDDTILLDRDWDKNWWDEDSPVDPDKVWVVPPPVYGGRYPCIAVYQKMMRF